jgi:pilus assembly protein Flp/PilA
MTMHRFVKLIAFAAGQTKSLARDQSGATSIEYALIASGISIVILVAVNTLGTTMNTLYESVNTALK